MVRLNRGKHRFEPAPAFDQVASGRPEAPDGGGDPGRRQRVIRHRPGDTGPDVVVFGIEVVEDVAEFIPAALFGE
jgi:hypothetical protein